MRHMIVVPLPRKLDSPGGGAGVTALPVWRVAPDDMQDAVSGDSGPAHPGQR